MIPGQSTAIHWHGTDQVGTPHMDGVPMITQCPISQTTTFRYDFRADTFGTLYWHSHSGKADNC
jgi:FtsP/CotA-like multicopper oxidase with cupredoxin domain